MGQAINQWRVPGCTRTPLATLTLSTLIPSLKGGKCRLKYLREVCIFPCCYNGNLSNNKCDKSIYH